MTDTFKFLSALDPQATTWTFQTFDDGGDKRPKLAATRHGPLEQHAHWLAAQNAQGAGVFVTINETDGQGRKASNVTRVRAVFADFDAPEPDTMARLQADPLPPSIIVESSAGKWHAYWLADGLELADFKPLQQRIAGHWGSDPAVCDLSRVMRLPGFQHLKGEPQPVTLVEVSGERYSAADLHARYAPAQPPLEAPQRPAVASAGALSTYAEGALDSALERITGAAEGTRNATLNREAFGLAQLVASGELPESLARHSLASAASTAGLERAEIMRTIQSGFDSGLTQPRSAPERPGAPVDAGGFWDGITSEDGQSVAPPAAEGFQPSDLAEGVAPRRVLVEVDLGDVMTASLESVRYAVAPWFPRRHAALFGGHGGIGKSSLMLAIAAHVAAGVPFAGLAVEQSRVLFVSLEDEGAIVKWRLARIIEAYRLPVERVLENLHLLDGTLDFSALMTVDDRSGKPEFTPAFRELAAHAEGMGLVVIDNASDAFDANENSRRDVRMFIRGLAAVARRHNAAVVLLAHIDKAAAKDGTRGNSYSGSTAWHNSARSRLALVANGEDIQLMHEKNNLGPKSRPLRIVFVDSVPMPDAATCTDGGLTSEDFDQAEIIRALKAAAEAGITVPARHTPGNGSAMQTLEPLPEYAQSFRGNEGRKRAASALVALKRARRIVEVDYKDDQRKDRKRLDLVEVAECASTSAPSGHDDDAFADL